MPHSLFQLNKLESVKQVSGVIQDPDSQALFLACKRYQQNIKKNSPAELDLLFQALEAWHKTQAPNHKLKDRLLRTPLSKIVYPLFDEVMSLRRLLADQALRDHGTAVSRCLADLLSSPQLIGTDKRDKILSAVMGCLKEREAAKEMDMNSVPFGASPEDISNTKPTKKAQQAAEKDFMTQWLSEAVLDENSDLMKALKEHRHYSNDKNSIFSTTKETASMKRLHVAIIEDHIRDHEEIYGTAFLKAYQALAPSSDKARAVAQALADMKIKDRDDFVQKLGQDNSLTKALKMQGFGMSLFGPSKTWQRVQQHVLKDLDSSKASSYPTE